MITCLIAVLGYLQRYNKIYHPERAEMFIVNKKKLMVGAAFECWGLNASQPGLLGPLQSKSRSKRYRLLSRVKGWALIKGK